MLTHYNRPLPTPKICCIFLICYTFIVVLILLCVLNNSHHRKNSRLRVIKNKIKYVYNETVVNKWCQSLIVNETNDFSYGYINKPKSVHSIVEDSRTLVVAVLTPPSHLAQRSAIRETWGLDFKRYNAIVVFFMGQSGSAKFPQVDIDKESLKFDDIVQLNYTDSYENLRIKTQSLMIWFQTFYPEIQFIFKVDDDVYVNVEALLNVLSGYDNRTAIYGRLAHEWEPFRDRRSKYYIPEASFPFRYYPDFLAGPAYVLSNSAVPKLINVAMFMKPFILEDVFFTGFAAVLADVPRINLPGINTTVKRFSPCIFNRTIASHSHKPTELRKLWSRIHSPAFVCKNRRYRYS